MEWLPSNFRSKHPSSGDSDWLNWDPHKAYSYLVPVLVVLGVQLYLLVSPYLYRVHNLIGLRYPPQQVSVSVVVHLQARVHLIYS